MISVVIEQTGTHVSLWPDKVNRKLMELVNLTGDFAHRTMVKKAPKRTGRMARSILKLVTGFHCLIGPTVDYAIFVEEGTMPHLIEPVAAQALRFEIGGRVVFAKYVHHPGTKPQPFVRQTAEATRREIPRFWRMVWRTD